MPDRKEYIAQAWANLERAREAGSPAGKAEPQSSPAAPAPTRTGARPRLHYPSTAGGSLNPSGGE